MGLRSNGSGYLSTGIAGFPSTGVNQSIAFWATPSTYTGTNLSWININGTSYGIQIGVRNGVMLVWKYGGITLVASTANPSVGLHFFVYTYDSTNHRLYIDGILNNSAVVDNDNDAIINIQLFGNQWNENSTVTLEDMRVYNRTLSADEISSMYYSRGRNTIFQGLVARWLLWSGASGTNILGAASIKDVSINGNNGISISNSNTDYTYQESYVLSKPRPKVLK